MTRIRLTLLLLFLGIAVPTGLIVNRAVESLAIENAVQHNAVADRIFDEMERSLSDFLLREEARAPGEFALDTSHASPSSAGGLRADAFNDADEPFIVGWFAIDASRRIRLHASNHFASPDENRNRRTSRITLALREGLGSGGPAAVQNDARGGTPEEKQENAELRKRTAETVIVAERDAIRRKDAGNEGSASKRKSAPAPGRTKSLSEKGAGQRDQTDADLAAQEGASPYDLLQSLNRAQVLRSERQSKIQNKAEVLVDSSKDASAGFDLGELQALGYDLTSAAPQAAQATQASDAPQAQQAEPNEDREEEAIAERLPRTFAVDPLTSRATNSADILLVRSVWRGEEVERQGVVLDRGALAAWLEQSVLGETALGQRADLVFGQEADRASRAAHAYLHRFGEPFEALLARLDLQPLPGLRSARPIYMIAGLLALVTVLGLFAVERMTRVVVDYAQRRSDFVAAVSHELKTPLTSIRMYSEMLRDGLVTSAAKRDEYYATITDESERLTRLINNVLEFSRLEQNRREPSLVVGGIADAVGEAAEKLRAHVERAGFVLELDLATDPASVQYDRDAVTQLLFNLVDNALKYARDAEDRRIRVILKPSVEGRLMLRVRDFGPGVPEDQMRRIFEPFFRAGEELTRDTAGTGIGLALVKELAEDMGATALGRNATGGGFEVCISFSAAAAPA